MVKLISLILIAICLILNAGAVIVGPYNVTVDLPEYGDIQSAGPNGNSEIGLVVYQIDITKGNSTMPSENVHVPEILVRILKYSTPIGIYNPANLKAFYNIVEKRLISSGLYVVRGDIVFDGHEVASWKSPTYNYRHIGYFINNNVFIEIAAFNLPAEDMNVLLRTFHVQES